MKFANLSLLSVRARPESCVRVLISAGETSSDIHGARLLRALRENLPPGIELDAFGVGGPLLQAEGLKAVVDSRELSTMGFLEVLLRLPHILRLLGRVTQAAEQKRPDVAVVIDYPGFHFRLARKLKKLKIPLVYYIPPKIWVWRQHRVQFLKRFFDRVLCIFPFEEKLYYDLGLPVQYVGNPLVEELPLNLTREQARKQIGLDSADPVLVLMPGSRQSELNHHLELMLDGVALAVPALVKARYLGINQKLKVLIPFPESTDLEAVQLRIREWSRHCDSLDLRVSQGNSAVCLVAADAGLIKSGTSTLEAGLLDCPHVVVYRPNRTGIWIYRNVIRYKGYVGLVNLMAGPIVPEILCENVTSQNLAQQVVRLLTDEGMRQQMRDGFKRLRAVIGSDLGSPSVRAAIEVLSVVREMNQACLNPPSSASPSAAERLPK